MITLAGPSSRAIPISVSSSFGVRRGLRPATGGSPTARSTCLIGSLTVIAHLPANCENACFLILQPAGTGVKMGFMATAPTTSARPYGGVDAADRLATRRARLLEAGLDLLGGDDAAELTVRGVCRQAGVAARYFYESFTDKDELVGAVFDWVIAELAFTTQAAVDAAPPEEQTRAGMTNIVRTIGGDPARRAPAVQRAVGQRRAGAQTGRIQRAVRDAVRPPCREHAACSAERPDHGCRTFRSRRGGANDQRLADR